MKRLFDYTSLIEFFNSLPEPTEYDDTSFVLTRHNVSLSFQIYPNYRLSGGRETAEIRYDVRLNTDEIISSGVMPAAFTIEIQRDKRDSVARLVVEDGRCQWTVTIEPFIHITVRCGLQDRGPTALDG